MEPFFAQFQHLFRALVASSLHQILFSSLSYPLNCINIRSKCFFIYPSLPQKYSIPNNFDYNNDDHVQQFLFCIYFFFSCILFGYLILVFQMPVNLTLEPQLSFFEFYTYTRLSTVLPHTHSHTPSCISKYYFVLFSQQVNIHTHIFLPKDRQKRYLYLRPLASDRQNMTRLRFKLNLDNRVHNYSLIIYLPNYKGDINLLLIVFAIIISHNILIYSYKISRSFA